MHPLFTKYPVLSLLLVIPHRAWAQAPSQSQTNITESIYCIEVPEVPNFQGRLSGPPKITCPAGVSRSG